MNPLTHYLRSFLQAHWDQKSPLLLAYSGGGDSKALLYALLEVPGICLHLAHVDHGWRQESRKEAESLKEEAERLGLPFHETRLEASDEDLSEERARAERLSFLQKIAGFVGAQAILLGHQKEELAETVFKRVFEGAHLSFLGGMQPVCCARTIPLWRPFLYITKQELKHFLQEKALVALEDPSNQSRRFLRGRMRQDLDEVLGKNSLDNWQWLSQRSFELREYLDRKTAALTLHSGPWGTWVDLRETERIEQRHIIQKLQAKRGIPLPRGELEQILDLLQKQSANITLSARNLFIDRGSLFFLSSCPPTFPLSCFLPIEEQQWGGWEVQKEPCSTTLSFPSWKQVWTGSFEVPFREGLSYQMLFSSKKLRKLWNKTRVPAFLREKVPVWVGEMGEVWDWLSMRPSQEDFTEKLSFLWVSKTI